MGLTIWQASGILLLLFTTGAVANAGRAMIMRMAGLYISFNPDSFLSCGTMLAVITRMCVWTESDPDINSIFSLPVVTLLFRY